MLCPKCGKWGCWDATAEGHVLCLWCGQESPAAEWNAVEPAPVGPVPPLAGADPAPRFERVDKWGLKFTRAEFSHGRYKVSVSPGGTVSLVLLLTGRMELVHLPQDPGGDDALIAALRLYRQHQRGELAPGRMEVDADAPIELDPPLGRTGL